MFSRTVVANLNLPLSATGTPANAYASDVAPDIVGNVPRRPGLGSIPDFRFSSRGQRLLQHPELGLVNPFLGAAGGVYPTPAPANATGLAPAQPNSLSEISRHPEASGAVP